MLGSIAQDVPELALETTVLNRLAVLEALCASQAHAITWLQAEINDLRSSLAASAPVEVLCAAAAAAAITESVHVMQACKHVACSLGQSYISLH